MNYQKGGRGRRYFAIFQWHFWRQEFYIKIIKNWQKIGPPLDPLLGKVSNMEYDNFYNTTSDMQHGHFLHMRGDMGTTHQGPMPQQ